MWYRCRGGADDIVALVFLLRHLLLLMLMVSSDLFSQVEDGVNKNVFNFSPTNPFSIAMLGEPTLTAFIIHKVFLLDIVFHEIIIFMFLSIKYN